MRKSLSHYIYKSLYKYSNPRFFKRFNEYFNNKSKINKREYLEIYEASKKLTAPHISSYLKSKEKKIDDNFIQNLALLTQITIKKSEVQYFHGKLLYSIVANELRERKLDYVNIFEIGTARGFSSMCMAKALDDFKINGHIVSLDLLPHNESIYWGSISDNDGKLSRKNLLNNYKNLLNYVTYIQSSSPIELFKLGINNINLCFIDGEHTYKSVIKESNFVAKFQSKGDIIFFDDYNKILFPGCVKAIDEFCLKHKYDKYIIEGYKSRNFVIAKKK